MLLPPPWQWGWGRGHCNSTPTHHHDGDSNTCTTVPLPPPLPWQGGQGCCNDTPPLPLPWWKWQLGHNGTTTTTTTTMRARVFQWHANHHHKEEEEGHNGGNGDDSMGTIVCAMVPLLPPPPPPEGEQVGCNGTPITTMMKRRVGVLQQCAHHYDNDGNMGTTAPLPPLSPPPWGWGCCNSMLSTTMIMVMAMTVQAQQCVQWYQHCNGMPSTITTRVMVLQQHAHHSEGTAVCSTVSPTTTTTTMMRARALQCT